jgi:hypothetical protein
MSDRAIGVAGGVGLCTSPYLHSTRPEHKTMALRPRRLHLNTQSVRTLFRPRVRRQFRHGKVMIPPSISVM